MKKEKFILVLELISLLLLSGSLFSGLIPITIASIGERDANTGNQTNGEQQQLSQPTSSTIAVGEPTSSSPCPELPNDGRPQPSKGANADAHKWKVVPMKDDVSMFKVVDSARTNVADQFHSKAHAEQYIAHFVCDTSPPPTETDAGVGVGSVGEVTDDGTMVVDEESEKETASQGDNYHPLDSALPPDTNVQAQGSIYNTAPLQNGVSILSNMTAPVTGAVAGLEIIKVIRD